MRSLFALALVVAACTRDDRSNQPAAARPTSSTRTARGPEALLLRVPRAGGVARATAYPNIDSVVWTGSDAVPPLERVLAFDAEAGQVAAEDTRNRPIWIDLRVGTVIVATPRSVRGTASVDGAAVYGIGVDGRIGRFTPSGNTVLETPAPARAVFPQINGTLLVLGGRGANARVWRLQPPDPRLLDTLTIPDASGGAAAPLGDRVYFITNDRAFVGVHARTFAESAPITFRRRIVSVAATPSGDRFYVITDSARALEVVARFQDRVVGQIDLPGIAREARIDPFGRYLLVRAARGDSVWIVSVGTDKVVGTVRSGWRNDLPFVAPDGHVAILDGDDVAFVDPTSLNEARRAVDGAQDFWYPFVWIGFRPRAAALDAPADFTSDTDSTTLAIPPTRAETAAAPAAPPVDSAKLGFTVSFAAVLDQTRAQSLAEKITVDGRSARVVTTMTEGTTVYRVVLGPFPTRDEADRVGRASGQSYYVYAGSP